MPRSARNAPGNVVYHVLNRGVGRMQLFRGQRDYQAFEQVLADALEAVPTRILAWCIMPNHWHLLLWPRRGGELARFMQRLGVMHARRWVMFRGRDGCGHVYQGRFKSFPVQDDAHLRTVGRYVERNAVRAGLAPQAQDWRWGSLWARHHADSPAAALLAPWPVKLPALADWTGWVNQPQSATELDALRTCIRRGRPYGSAAWVAQTAGRLALESSLRPRGRPKKAKEVRRD
jgi:putative transposase